MSLCCDWFRTHAELERATQVLVNNGYSNKHVQRVINEQMEKWYKDNNSPINPAPNKINIFYKNTMSTNHRADEDAIRKIIMRDVQAVNIDDKINFVIYYSSMKTSNLLIRNNNKKPTELQSSHLLYEYTCNKGECASPNNNNSYIGMTTTSLSRRLTLHLSNGSIKDHHSQVHSSKLTRTDLNNNTVIIHKERDFKRLQILEALYIKENNPSINKQNPDICIIPTSKLVNHKNRIKITSGTAYQRGSTSDHLVPPNTPRLFPIGQ